MASVDLGEENMKMHDFYGITNEQFCGEVHTMFHNTIVTANENMEEKLIKAYPERKEQISSSCSALLTDRLTQVESVMSLFSTFYMKNFRVPPNIPLYGADMKKEEEGGEGEEVMGHDMEKIIELNKGIIATQSLNDTLRERIMKVKEEIRVQENLEIEIEKQKKSLQELAESRAVLRQLQDSEPSKNKKTALT